MQPLLYTELQRPYLREVVLYLACIIKKVISHRYNYTEFCKSNYSRKEQYSKIYFLFLKSLFSDFKKKVLCLTSIYPNWRHVPTHGRQRAQWPDVKRRLTTMWGSTRCTTRGFRTRNTGSWRTTTPDTTTSTRPTLSTHATGFRGSLWRKKKLAKQ